MELFLQRSDDLWTGFLAMENLVGHSLPVVADNSIDESCRVLSKKAILLRPTARPLSRTGEEQETR